MEKIVLGFSGGLDTSFCAKYLSSKKNTEVYAITINTGGFSISELHSIQEKALSLGVTAFKAIDVTETYYQQCIKYLIFGNILKNNIYPLSVSAERVSQAIAIANYANEIDATAIAHGSTGAGNDQVRFDMIFNILSPNKKIITPIRDLKLSREAEIEYLQQQGVQADFTKAAYSINKGLWGTSVGGKETLTSHQYLPDNAFPSILKSTETKNIELHFNKGELVGINKEKFDTPVQAIQYLQALAEPYAIGRDVHVGDTIIGIKGRVGFEAAAPLIIIKAHHLLEKHTLSKYQLIIKDQLAQWYGTWLHEGLLLDAVMRDIEAYFIQSQKNVTGTVYVTLMPYQFITTGIKSDYDLMNTKFGAYGEMNNGWTGEDVKGFTKIFGNSIAIHHQINNQ